MKKYENPMLHVVSIKKNDIVTTSTLEVNTGVSVSTQYAPGQRDIDSWYEGY